MQSKAQLNYLRIAPRKVRLVTDLVRGKDVLKAENILSFTTKRAALPVLKLLKQAMANAENSLQLDSKNLFISKITVDEGPKLKRWRPRSRGQAYQIQKKTSHITIILDEIKETKKKSAKKKTATKGSVTKTGLVSGEDSSEITRDKSVYTKPVVEKPKFKPQTEITKGSRFDSARQGAKRIFRRKAV